MNVHRCLLPEGTTLRPYRSNDLSQIIQIANDQLGAGYLEASSITGYAENAPAIMLTSPPSHTYGEPITFVVTRPQVVALPDGSEMPHEPIIGFAHGYVQAPSAAESILPVSLPSYLSQQRLIGCIKTVSVRADHQRMGIKSALVHQMLDTFRERGIRAVYGITRQLARSERPELAQIMRQHDCSIFARIPGYWSQASKSGAFNCTNCDTPPCQCVAVAYGRRL